MSPADARRVVVAPRDLAVVGLHGGGGGPDLPDAVALGSAAGGTVVMLFRFDAAWREDAEVESAFLVLEAMDGAPPAGSPIHFEAARVAEPWRADAVSWGRQPRLDVPFTAGAARPRPSIPMRIDVTKVVRGFAQHDGGEHGIALLARGDDPVGAVVSLGVTRGRGPRLEVYVK